MDAIESWVCPTCNTTISTPFCAACGEGRPAVRDLTLRGLFAQFLHAFSAVDRRLIRSFRCLITQPGVLTVSYLQGQRIPYVGPFQLFLIANLLFFGMQLLTNTNIVSSTLDSHLHQQDWGAFAQTLVTRRLEIRRMSVYDYTPVFNQAVVLYAKSFIILMVVPFSILLHALFYKNSRPFVAHLVFALYFYAFLLILFCAILALAGVQHLLGGAGLNAPGVDNILTIVNLAACALYLYKATTAVYGASGKARIIKVLLLTLTVEAILLGYRFLMFLLTLYTT